MARKASKTRHSVRSYQQQSNRPLPITPVEYGGLQVAYDHFNKTLFAGALPDCFITYQRKANSLGYFSADRFAGRVGQFAKHELALNPDAFIGQTDQQVCQNGARLAAALRRAVQARLSQQRMDGEDEDGWLAAVIERRGRRQRNRAENVGLYHSRWPVRRSRGGASRSRLGAQSAVGASARAKRRDQQQQDQIQLLGVRAKRLGQTRPGDPLRAVPAADARHRC